MTQVRAGRIGPDPAATTPVAGAYNNEVQTDRARDFWAFGGRGGVLGGFVPSVVAGALRIDFTAGAAAVREVFSASVTQNRAYLVWADTVTQVPIAANAGGSARIDTIVAAAVDTEAGSYGTGIATTGGHLVAVPGTVGSGTAPSNADIIAYLGKGGWERLAAVTVDPGVTTIAAGKLVPEQNALNRNQNFLASLVAVNGFTPSAATAIVEGTHIDLLIQFGTKTGNTYTGSATAGSNGAATGTPNNPQLCTGVPAAFRPAAGTVVYGMFNAPNRGGTCSLDSSGVVTLQTLYPGSTIAAGQTGMVVQFSYSVEIG